MLTFVPSLGTGEVFAFGAGVPLPTRMKFRDVPLALRPTSEAGGNTRIAAGASPDRDLIDSVIERWRAATMSKGASTTTTAANYGSWRDDIAPVREEVPRYQPAPPVQLPPCSRRTADAAAAAGCRRPPTAPPAPPPPPPSILRRPLSSEPLGPNNPAPLPSRYR